MGGVYKYSASIVSLISFLMFRACDSLTPTIRHSFLLPYIFNDIDDDDGDYSFFDSRTDQMYISENEENHDLENITKKMIAPKERKLDNISLGDLPSCSYSTQNEMRRSGTQTENVIVHEDESSSSDEEQPD
ncbi:hypothetical protein HHI36_004035 [Cryptolaemus montrouzieri]|uniref:Secreted protein n=1 Tax=Cryptolaemus montrouzieri TaxID=559131 RepID=A0ABD2NQE3_9CUCU